MNSNSLKAYLSDPVDNTSLVIFRMAFGLLLAAEAFGAIMTGWVRRVFIEPEFTFTFIGFEWLQPLPGFGMYVYYILMGIAGLMVLTGYYYRIGLGIYTLMWWCVYLMQKTSYNNHYYLLILLCFMMLLVPAHRNGSFDAHQGRVPVATTCPRWCIEIFKLQLLIVFTYAALAKLYPGWLNGDFISTSFAAKSHYPIIGDLLQQRWLQKLVIYGGIAYDLTVIPLLYWSQDPKVWSGSLGGFSSVQFGGFRHRHFSIPDAGFAVLVLSHETIQLQGTRIYHQACANHPSHPANGISTAFGILHLATLATG